MDAGQLTLSHSADSANNEPDDEDKKPQEGCFLLPRNAFCMVTFQRLTTQDYFADITGSVKAKYEGGEFPFDGAVLKHDVYSSLEDSVAYKFENERIQTTLNDVVGEWQDRTATPVAIFNPISFRLRRTERISTTSSTSDGLYSISEHHHRRDSVGDEQGRKC